VFRRSLFLLAATVPGDAATRHVSQAGPPPWWSRSPRLRRPARRCRGRSRMSPCLTEPAGLGALVVACNALTIPGYPARCSGSAIR